MVQINPKNYVEDDTDAAFIPMEKIDATYLSNFTYSVRKWKEIKSGFTHFADGDVAFAKITPCFQNRKSMILKALPNGIGAGTTELKVLRTYGETLSKEYLLFFLESPYFVEEAKFKGTANQQRIISGYLEEKLFPIPPMEEQKRVVEKILNSFAIVEKYSKAQEMLDNLNKNISPLLRKSILQEAIQGHLVPQDPNDEPASVLLQHIKEEKLRLVKEGKLKKKDVVDSVIYKGDDNRYYEQIGKDVTDITDEIPFEIPDSWCWCRMKNLVRIISGTSYAKGNVTKSGIRIIRGGNIQRNILLFFDDDVFLPHDFSDEEKNIRKNDIVIVASTGSKEVIGKPAFIDQDFSNTQIGAFLRIIRPHVELYSSFLRVLFASEYYRKHIRDMVKGTNINNIKAEHIDEFILPLPPLTEQQRIVNQIEKIFSEINGN